MTDTPLWVVEYYPNDDRYATYGPKPDKRSADLLLADLAATALNNIDKFDEVRVGIYEAADAAAAVEAARAARQDI